MISTVTTAEPPVPPLAVPEVSDKVRAELWESSGRDIRRFRQLLVDAGFGESRLAGQVNLLVHMWDRGHQLGLQTWDELCAETGLTYETIRKLRVIVRVMQVRTKKTIADTLGWTLESIDAMLDGGQPVLAANWAAPRSQAEAGIPAEPDQRAVLIELKLTAEDLAVVEARYDAGDPLIRQLAQAIARALVAGIDQKLLDHLLRTARDTTTRALADERNSVHQLGAMLDTLTPGVVQERSSALQ